MARRPVFASFALALSFMITTTAAWADEAPAPPPPSRVELAGPLVELSADDERASIERRATTTSAIGLPLLETGVLAASGWEHACVAPCQVRLDARYAYRVAGDGLVPTPSFSLPRGSDHVKVDATMGSSTGRIAGFVVGGAGALALLAGGAAVGTSLVLASEDVGSQGFRDVVLAGGITTAALGAVALGTGLLLWLTNGSNAHTEAPVFRQAAR